MDKNLFLSQLSQGKAQLEANAAFFVKKVDPKRLSKGKKLQHYYKGVMADRQGNAVLEWSIPSQSDPSKSYTCFIDIIPKDTTLFNIAKAKAKLADRVQTLKDADVKCFCSCPDFNWAGMKYNMKHIHKSLSADHHADDVADDQGEDINPSVRDPKHKNTLCKHLVAACAGVLTNAATIMKDVRGYTPEARPQPEPKREELPIGNNAEDVKERIDAEKPEEKEAMDTFDTAPGMKTEDTQKVLDALADNIEPGQQPAEEIKDNPTEDVLGDSDKSEPGQPSELAKEDPTLGLLGAEPKPNHMVDYDEESNLDMYDVPVDEEPSDDYDADDDEILRKSPLALPD